MPAPGGSEVKERVMSHARTRPHGGGGNNYTKLYGGHGGT